MSKRESDGSLEEKTRKKFVRNFDHIDGNWPSYIYLDGRYKCLQRISNICLNHIHKHHNTLEIIDEKNPHVSLSKPFVLRHHQIDTFISELGSSVSINNRFSVQVFSEYQLLINENGTRLFATLPLEDRDGSISKLVSATDKVLRKFSQPVYYQDPIYHISIASSPVDKDSASAYSPEVTKVSANYPIARKYVSFAPKVVDISSSVRSESESDGDSSSNDSEEVEVEVKERYLQQDSTLNVDDTKSEDEEEEDIECLGAVLGFEGVECRIGNRLFRMPFKRSHSTTSNKHQRFVEIK